MTNSKDRIEELIKQFQQIDPGPTRSLGWYLAIQKKTRQRGFFLRYAIGLAAGIAIGIFIGTFLLGTNRFEEEPHFASTYEAISVRNF